MNIKLDYSDIQFKENGKLKLLIIVGTRPEIIRLAAVINKCRQYFDTILAHTGQNYDYNLNGIFFKDLKLADPEVYMDAVGDDLGATVGNIINCSYKLMSQIKPDALLILGDTNSCLSAIAAKRLQLLVNQSTLLDQGTDTYVFIFGQEVDVAEFPSPPLMGHVGKPVACTSRYTNSVWEPDFMVHQIIQHPASEYTSHSTAFEH